MESAGSVLILVENLSVPFDQRVRREAWALREAGYTVSVICPRGVTCDTEKHATLDGIHIYRYQTVEARQGLSAYALEYSQALIMMTWITLKVWLRHGFDVIHLCNPPDLLFLVALPYKLLGKRIVFDHHDLSPEVYLSKTGKPPGGLVYRLLCALERATFHVADIVIATNVSYAQKAATRGGVAPAAIYVVRNGPDPARVAVRPANPVWKQGKPYLIAYIGTLGKQDGGDVLLRMFDVLVHARGRRDVHLLVMGGGPEIPALRDQVAQLDLNDVVTITGRISDEDVMEGLSTADICVSPDPATPLNEVSTMNKTMEYMALGKPVVAFDLKETRVSGGEGVLYAESEDEFIDGLENLLDHPELRARLGAYGYERVRTQLSWEHSKGPLLRAYHHAFELFGHGRKVKPA